MTDHNKITFSREYCLCRRIPYRFYGEQLIVGGRSKKEIIFSVYNLSYSDLMMAIDELVVYDEYGYYSHMA